MRVMPPQGAKKSSLSLANFPAGLFIFYDRTR
jgi:hypothetical protein